MHVVERSQSSAQHLVPAGEGSGALKRQHISGLFDDADHAGITVRSIADGAGAGDALEESAAAAQGHSERGRLDAASEIESHPVFRSDEGDSDRSALRGPMPGRRLSCATSAWISSGMRPCACVQSFDR